MKGTRFIAITAGLVSFFITASILAEVTPEYVIDRMEDLTRGDSMHARLEIQIERTRINRSLTVETWDDSIGDRAFIRILKPRKDAGTTFLKVKNNLWQYLPKIGKEIKIEGSLMQDSWMGSDFTNDDLMRATSLVDDYEHRFVEAPSDDIYRIELKPKPGAAVVWSRIILDVKKEKYLPVREDFYDHKDRLKKVMKFSDYRSVNGRVIPIRYVMESIENDRIVSVTRMIFQNINFNIKLSPGIFSKANMRR